MSNDLFWKQAPILRDNQQQDSDLKPVDWWFEARREEDHFLGGEKTMITIIDTNDSLLHVEQNVSLNFLSKFITLLKNQPECIEKLDKWLTALDEAGF